MSDILSHTVQGRRMTAGYREGNNSHYDDRTLLSFHVSVRDGTNVCTEMYVQISLYLSLRNPFWCREKQHGANNGYIHIETIRKGKEISESTQIYTNHNDQSVSQW